MFIELGLRVTDDFVRISEANQPETRRDTYEREIVHICQWQIAQAKRHDKYTPLRLTDTETIASWF